MGKPSKRRAQKAAERRKAKRKAAGPSLPQVRLPSIPSDSPTYECLIPRNLFELGLGNVVVAREFAPGRIAMATFLLDVFCLGVKDVAFGVCGVADYRQRTRFAADGSFEALSAANARALVEGAVAYAQQFGLPPHPDYPVASRIFAGVDPGLADRVFSYGKDGKPLYISGPRDTAAKSKRVLAALERVCGPGGYDFMVAIGEGMEA